VVVEAVAGEALMLILLVQLQYPHRHHRRRLQACPQ
jgi:hypothetical protein